MDRLDQAREAVRRYPVPETLRTVGHVEVTGDELADALDYFVDLAFTDVETESAVPLGASKYKGLPHLPPGLDWPAGHFFTAQFNLAELHPDDVFGAFPATGVLYLFMPETTDVTVLHYDGPLDALRITPYPDAATLPGAEHYLADHLKQSSLLRYHPHYVFDLPSESHEVADVAKLVPAELKGQVGAVLRAKLATERHQGVRLFGPPTYWQGEEDGLDLREYFGEDYYQDQDPARVEKMLYTGRKYLLFQDENYDGNTHVWIKADEAARRDYSDAWVTYSGT